MQRNTNLHQVDIIIIGAGPAGCAAAIRARQAGLSVLMFDMNSYPKVVPGETLHPGIEVIFKQLGIVEQVMAANFKRHLGIYIQRGECREFLPYGQDESGPWQGFQVDRRIFHQILQQAALKVGISLIRSISPCGVLMDCGRVIGVEVNGSQYFARWTLDATGRSAWLATRLGLRVNVRSPQMAARFGWFKGQPNDNDAPVFVFQEDGWDWQAPLGDDQTAWVKLRFAAADSTGPEGVDLTWKYRSPCAGPGFFILGDAAATLDPSSSHGVLRALMSGIFCAHLLEGLYDGTVMEADVIESYQSWLLTQFTQDEQRLRQYYLDSPVGTRFATWSDLN